MILVRKWMSTIFFISKIMPMKHANKIFHFKQTILVSFNFKKQKPTWVNVEKMKYVESKGKNMVWLLEVRNLEIFKTLLSAFCFICLYVLTYPASSIYLEESGHPKLLSLHSQVQPLSEDNQSFPSPNSQFLVERIWMALFSLRIIPCSNHLWLWK